LQTKIIALWTGRSRRFRLVDGAMILRWRRASDIGGRLGAATATSVAQAAG